MLFCTLALLALPQAAYDGPPLPKLVPEITRAEIEYHLRTLASDAMLGRATGSPESEIAAHYLSEVLKAYGIAPAGDDGTFLQDVHYQKTVMRGTPTLAVETSDGSKPASVFETDWRCSGSNFEKRTLPVVVAHTADEVTKDAFEGKALFLDEPDRTKQRDAISRAGAALSIVPDLGKPLPRNRPALALKGALLDAFRAGKVKSLTLEVVYEKREVPAHNVVGVLRGEGPGAAKAIVLGAHYDHIGGEANPADGKDHINNGADDDASGCTVVLELAGALAKEGHHAHSIIFLLATGEEIGNVGADYQLAHPAVPVADTIANLNFEMLGRPDPLVGGAGKMWLTGWEETNLGESLVAAGVDIAPDKRPDQHFYERSDNIAYVHKGVVGQTFSTFNLHKDYHQVSDEADRIDFDHLTSCAQQALKAVDLVANGKIVPAFKPKPAKDAKDAKDKH